MKVVYICHPYAGDPAGNKEKVDKIVDEIGKNNLEIKLLESKVSKYLCLLKADTSSGSLTIQSWTATLDKASNSLEDFKRVIQSEVVVPLSVFHAFDIPSFLESEKVDRSLVMEYCKTLLRKCDEIWIYAKSGITEGMKEEIELASELGINLKFKSL